ncbi:MAG: acetyl-CoA carboxylase carboxyltransferase subunit alpha [Syntrophomonas sp.]|nr:acetyl-CoA carboxylase carboxyltransferase subunit alpha [Syntrophomonas sp.]
MARNKFEFEEPYLLLESKLEDLKKLSEQLNTDFSEEINHIEKRLDQMMEERYKRLTPWEQVLLARDLDRPMTRDYIRLLCSDFIELHGDRVYGDDLAMVGGIGMMGGRAVTIIGHQKGRNTKENISHNFGMPRPEGYRKAYRLLKQAEKFGRPVLTFINTPGADPGIGAEERGQAWAISEMLCGLSSLRVPIISVVTGEGGSGGALALAVADRIVMLSNTVFSVISPESCASILMRDVKRADEMAGHLKMNAQALYEMRIVDEVIEEPARQYLLDSPDFVEKLKNTINNYLDELGSLEISKLLEQRYSRFRQIGQFLE